MTISGRAAPSPPTDGPAGQKAQSTPAAGSSRFDTRAPAERLPRPPGRRRPGVALLAVLLIVLGAATAGLLALRLDTRSQVLVARHDIAVGSQIQRDDLAVTRVAADGVPLISADQADQVIGRYATTQITAGRLLDPGMLGSTGLLTSDRAAVGMALSAGRFPASGLQSGDVVQVVRIVDGEGQVLSPRGIVGSVQTPSDSVFGADGGDTTVVTVIVPRAEAPDVAAAAGADQVSLVLLTRGQPVGS